MWASPIVTAATGTAIAAWRREYGDDSVVIPWVREAWTEVAKFGTGNVYLNFLSLSDEAPTSGVDSAFGDNMRRLAEVKKKYDPTNLFRLNNNIAPAS
jgi:Berberine and berberine like